MTPNHQSHAWCTVFIHKDCWSCKRLTEISAFDALTQNTTSRITNSYTLVFMRSHYRLTLNVSSLEQAIIYSSECCRVSVVMSEVWLHRAKEYSDTHCNTNQSFCKATAHRVLLSATWLWINSFFKMWWSHCWRQIESSDHTLMLDCHVPSPSIANICGFTSLVLRYMLAYHLQSQVCVIVNLCFLTRVMLSTNSAVGA